MLKLVTPQSRVHRRTSRKRRAAGETLRQFSLQAPRSEVHCGPRGWTARSTPAARSSREDAR